MKDQEVMFTLLETEAQLRKELADTETILEAEAAVQKVPGAPSLFRAPTDRKKAELVRDRLRQLLVELDRGEHSLGDEKS